MALKAVQVEKQKAMAAVFECMALGGTSSRSFTR